MLSVEGTLAFLDKKKKKTHAADVTSPNVAHAYCIDPAEHTRSRIKIYIYVYIYIHTGMLTAIIQCGPFSKKSRFVGIRGEHGDNTGAPKA